MSELVAIREQELGTAPIRRRRLLPVSVALSMGFLFVAAICAVLGVDVAPQDPNAQHLLAALAHPSSNHWLGTDDLGRDVLSRTIVGARTALEGPLVIALGSMPVGVILGLAAGYLGGIVDTIISRWIDLMYSLPSLLVAIVVVGVLGGGYWIGVFVLTVLFMPYNTRLIRGSALEQKSLPYIEAVRVLGASKTRVMFYNMLPVILPLVVSMTALNFAFALVSLSGLSFLGLGVPPGTADWGRMLSDGIPLVFQNPLVAIVPGIAIVCTATSMNLFGDWIFEVLAQRSRMR